MFRRKLGRCSLRRVSPVAALPPEDVFTPRAVVSPEMFARRNEPDLKGNPGLQDSLREALRERGGQVLMYGDTGVGKSSLLKYAAEDEAMGLVSVECFSNRSFEDLMEEALRKLVDVREIKRTTSKSASAEVEASGGAPASPRRSSPSPTRSTPTPSSSAPVAAEASGPCCWEASCTPSCNTPPARSWWSHPKRSRGRAPPSTTRRLRETEQQRSASGTSGSKSQGSRCRPGPGSTVVGCWRRRHTFDYRRPSCDEFSRA